jgi:hypothetical protein
LKVLKPSNFKPKNKNFLLIFFLIEASQEDFAKLLQGFGPFGVAPGPKKLKKIKSFYLIF